VALAAAPPGSAPKANTPAPISPALKEKGCLVSASLIASSQPALFWL